jgi:hypothetical protein
MDDLGIVLLTDTSDDLRNVIDCCIDGGMFRIDFSMYFMSCCLFFALC